MSKSGFSSLDKSMQKTKEWLHDVQDELEWEDEKKVYIAFKAVIQTLRDRLPVEEAIELGDELPMVMKGIYYDGYTPRRKPEKIKNQAQFFQKVQEKSALSKTWGLVVKKFFLGLNFRISSISSLSISFSWIYFFMIFLKFLSA